MSREVLIVGGGLAGLSCAVQLQNAGVPYRLFEASDRVGGRVRTDRVDGFLLDRGFQVFLDAYPEPRRVLDFEALQLQAFLPGALVFTGSRLVRLADPLRCPAAFGDLVRQKIAGVRDAVKTLALRRSASRMSADGPSGSRDQATMAFLREKGFSARMIDMFWRPFLGGIFLEPDLETSRRMFDFVFGMFTRGRATLPASGMEAIPRQLAEKLDASRIHLETPVERIEPNRLWARGESWGAQAVVLAADGWSAASLVPSLHAPQPRGVCNLYFRAARPPYEGPWLALNGAGSGCVNNLAVPSNVCPSYASGGEALVSVSVLAADARDVDLLPERVRDELSAWFGDQVRAWTHLRTYHLPHALPAQNPGWLEPVERPVQLADGLLVCGDHRDNASIQGAMVSGRRAAEAVLEQAGAKSGLN